MSSIYIWQQAGTLCVIQGHFAILPVTITHNGSPLRATNPLPCSGEQSRRHAVQSLGQLAHTLHIQHLVSCFHPFQCPSHCRLGFPSQCVPARPKYCPVTMRSCLCPSSGQELDHALCVLPAMGMRCDRTISDIRELSSPGPGQCTAHHGFAAPHHYTESVAGQHFQHPSPFSICSAKPNHS